MFVAIILVILHHITRMCNGSKGNDKFNNSRMAKVIIRTTRKVMPALLPPGAIDDIAKRLRAVAGKRFTTP